jgi:hypothetical protein
MTHIHHVSDIFPFIKIDQNTLQSVMGLKWEVKEQSRNGSNWSKPAMLIKLFLSTNGWMTYTERKQGCRDCKLPAK